MSFVCHYCLVLTFYSNNRISLIFAETINYSLTSRSISLLIKTASISNIDDTLTRLHHDEIIPDTNSSFSDEGENSANQSTMNNDTNNCNCNEQNSDADGTPYDEEIEDPLNEYRAPANETCLQTLLPDYPVTSGSEVYSIAPGANKHPVSFMMDRQCKELAFPVVSKKAVWLHC